MDLGIAARVFDAACDPAGTPLYSVTTCSLGGRPVRTHEGFRIVVDHDESLLESADTVVIATQEPERHLLATGELPPEVAGAFARIGPRTRVVSLCTSAFLLAAAGLLDGLRATTHWALCDAFARLFPRIEVDPDVLFVDNGRVLTSAGGAAGIDVCLHLIRRDHGAAVAGAAAAAVWSPRGARAGRRSSSSIRCRRTPAVPPRPPGSGPSTGWPNPSPWRTWPGTRT